MFDLGLMYLPFLLFSGVCLENKLFDNENIYHHMKIHLKICKNRKKFKLLLLTKN